MAASDTTSHAQDEANGIALIARLLVEHVEETLAKAPGNAQAMSVPASNPVTDARSRDGDITAATST